MILKDFGDVLAPSPGLLKLVSRFAGPQVAGDVLVTARLLFGVTILGAYASLDYDIVYKYFFYSYFNVILYSVFTISAGLTGLYYRIRGASLFLDGNWEKFLWILQTSAFANVYTALVFAYFYGWNNPEYVREGSGQIIFVFLHGVNVVFMLLDLLMSSMFIYLPHFYPALAITAIYPIFYLLLGYLGDYWLYSELNGDEIGPIFVALTTASILSVTLANLSLTYLLTRRRALATLSRSIFQNK